LRKYLDLSGKKNFGANIRNVELASWESWEKISLEKGRMICRELEGGTF
jgi:hypothetical protein